MSEWHMTAITIGLVFPWLTDFGFTIIDLPLLPIGFFCKDNDQWEVSLQLSKTMFEIKTQILNQ